MSYEIKRNITIYNFNQKIDRPIKYIVLHWVGAVSTAQNNATYFASKQLDSSAHYFIDKSSIWQSVEDLDVAWHCGTSGQYKHPECRNANSIGIEMCLEADMSICEETLLRTIWLVKMLMKKHNISLKNVIRHYDVTGKNCPLPFIEESKWAWLKNRIESPNETVGNSNLTEIVGLPRAKAAQMASCLLEKNPNPKLPNCTAIELANLFIIQGLKEGIRGDIAWCQSLKETGYFKYGGIVNPEQNNFAGIGALNNNTNGICATFLSPYEGVLAQIQHLKAYANTLPLECGCVDPRFHLVKRGSAPYVEWLGKEDNPNGAGWAVPGAGYGNEILEILKAVLQVKTETIDPLFPEWQMDAYKKAIAKGIIKSPEYWDSRLDKPPTTIEVIALLANML